MLALDTPAAAVSVAAHGSCTIANVAERVPLDILISEERAAVLAQRRVLGYQYFSILWKAGRQSIVHISDNTSACSSTVCVAFSCLSGG